MLFWIRYSSTGKDEDMTLKVGAIRESPLQDRSPNLCLLPPLRQKQTKNTASFIRTGGFQIK